MVKFPEFLGSPTYVWCTSPENEHDDTKRVGHE